MQKVFMCQGGKSSAECLKCPGKEMEKKVSCRALEPPFSLSEREPETARGGRSADDPGYRAELDLSRSCLPCLSLHLTSRLKHSRIGNIPLGSLCVVKATFSRAQNGNYFFFSFRSEPISPCKPSERESMVGNLCIKVKMRISCDSRAACSNEG